MGTRRERFRTDNQNFFIAAIESLCTGDESLDFKKLRNANFYLNILLIFSNKAPENPFFGHGSRMVFVDIWLGS